LARPSEKLFFDNWVSEKEEDGTVKWVSSGELFKLYKVYCEGEGLTACHTSLSLCKKIITQNGKLYVRKGIKNRYYASKEYIGVEVKGEIET